MTAEPIAAYTASLVKNIQDAVVVDGCCSVGGNLIQFAKMPNVKNAVGVELSDMRLSYASINCEVYKVKPKVTLLSGSIDEVEILESVGLS